MLVCSGFVPVEAGASGGAAFVAGAAAAAGAGAVAAAGVEGAALAAGAAAVGACEGVPVGAAVDGRGVRLAGGDVGAPVGVADGAPREADVDAQPEASAPMRSTSSARMDGLIFFMRRCVFRLGAWKRAAQRREARTAHDHGCTANPRLSKTRVAGTGGLRRICSLASSPELPDERRGP